MHNRLVWDLIFLLVFSLGQFLFMLRRADLARRSPLNGVKSIGMFFAMNWVTLLFRAIIEWGVCLWPYRSASAQWVNSLIAHIGINVPFQIPSHRGLAGCFFLGVFSDMVLDWVTMQDKIFGIPIPKAVKETIPQLPQVQQLVSTLTK